MRNGEWDLSTLQHLFPSEKIDEIRAVPCALIPDCTDSSFWGASPSGRFTVSSAYKLLSSDTKKNSSPNYEWIWRLRLPERVRFFIWLLLQNKLNTNELRMKKGMCSSANCSACNDSLESAEHIFRSFPYALFSWT